LIALCAEDLGIGVAVLHEDFRLQLEQVRVAVAEIAAKFSSATANTNVELNVLDSYSFRDVLYWAGQEAIYANHRIIGTEHLLLGLTYTRDKALLEIFKRLNLSSEEIRAKVHARIPEISLEENQRGKLKDRIRTEFYHNFAYYIPQPIRKLFGRFLDSSKMPPLG